MRSDRQHAERLHLGNTVGRVQTFIGDRLKLVTTGGCSGDNRFARFPTMSAELVRHTAYRIRRVVPDISFVVSIDITRVRTIDTRQKLAISTTSLI